MTRFHRTLIALAWFIGCASLPRPSVLDRSRATSTSPAQQEARQLAPQAYANAERLRLEAESAFDGGELERARALGEQSLAAFERATTQANLARAEQRVALAQKDLTDTEQELAGLQAHQQKLDAEIRALELRYKVERDAEPRVAIAPASPQREAARRAAARSTSEQARLFCVAAQLLEPQQRDELGAQLESVDSLQAGLSKARPSESISEALDLRAACLQALTRARRQAPAADTPAGSSLLSRLTAALPDTAPFEDDRGVVIVEEDLVGAAHDTLGAAARQRLQRLAEVAQAHPQLPVLVVIHSEQGEQGSARLLDELKRELAHVGLQRAVLHHSGNRLPTAARLVKGAKPNANRIEFVFVTR